MSTIVYIPKMNLIDAGLTPETLGFQATHASGFYLRVHPWEQCPELYWRIDGFQFILHKDRVTVIHED